MRGLRTFGKDFIFYEGSAPIPPLLYLKEKKQKMRKRHTSESVSKADGP